MNVFYSLRVLLLGLLLVSLGCNGGGCGRTIGPGDDKGTNLQGDGHKPESPIEIILRLVHGSMDSQKAQDLVKHVNDHQRTNPQVREELAKHKPDPDLLSKRFGLSVGDIDGLASSEFTREDGYHIDWCFRVEELVQLLKLEKLPPLQRAERAFAWVTRQVVLEDLEEVLLPPQFVVLRGRGDSRERALIFLDLLQQLDLQGCIVTVPEEKQGKKDCWLAGALINDGDKGEIYLFEPRLGMPVPGPDGKGIATLTQLRQQPELINQLSAGKDYQYDVTPEQAEKAEVLLACPMHALAPRMRFLEKLLSQQTGVKLFIDPARMVEQFEQAAGGPVSVWTEPKNSGDEDAQISPLRVLSHFFDGEDKHFFEQLYPLGSVRFHYRSLKVWGRFPPLTSASAQLENFSRKLFDNYYLFPQEKLTRGRLENMLPALRRIEKVLRELHQGKGREAWQEKVAKWWKQVESIYELQRENPAQFHFQQHNLWNEDQYLRWALVPVTQEEEDAQNLEIRPLGFVVLSATAEALEKEFRYLLAMYWLEKAERTQNELNKFLAGQSDPPKSRIAEAKQEWDNALHGIQKKYLNEYGLTPGNLPAQLQILRQRQELALLDRGLLDEFFRDLHRSLALRLQQIDILLLTGKTEQAELQAQQLAEDMQDLRDSAALKEVFDSFKAEIKKSIKSESLRKEYTDWLTELENTLAPGGSIYWLGHAAAVRVERKK